MNPCKDTTMNHESDGVFADWNRRKFLAGLAGAAAGGWMLQAGAGIAHAAASEIATGSLDHGLLAGTAKVDITPEGGGISILNSTLRPDESLFARVLVLREGEVTIAIVSLDLQVFSSAKVVAEARRRFGVDHVILSSTHTHAVPAPEALRLRPPPDDWTQQPGDPGEVIDWPGLSADPWYAQTEERVLQAIGEAAEKLFPAKLATGQAPFESAYMAHNRRKVKENGGVSMMWNNPKRLPTEPVDPTVGFLRVEDNDGKPRAFLVHYACHPVSTMDSGRVARDFPGAMVDEIERELGQDCLAMFLQGASGDIDPYDMRLRDQHAKNVTRNSGISLARGALRAAEGANASNHSRLRVQENLLTFPNREGGGTTEVLVTTVLLEDQTALVAIPGEVFIAHQLDLRQRAGIAHPFLLGLAYSGRGTPCAAYLPTEQAVREGGYGARERSFLIPSAGSQMIDAAVTAIAAMRSGEEKSENPGH